MHLEKITLINFKNYEQTTVSLSKRLNCFVGKNGMGKTNLLDAIYYLCMCKSNFGIRDRQVIRHEAPFFRLEGRFKTNKQIEKIVAKVIPGKKKDIERNDVVYQKLMEHIGLIPVVMIVPDDTLLASEGSEGRRKFLDNSLVQLDRIYLENLLKYNKVLRQKNAALKQFGKVGGYNGSLIDTYNEQMIGPANFIFNARQTFLDQFKPIFHDYYEVISGKAEEVDCVYKSQLKKESFELLLKQAEDKDRILQRSTVGIHKDDLIFTINGSALKTFASQGQLKSFVLALKLAQFEILRQQKDIAPILLLDDIFDKLDRYRVEQLIGLLLEREFGQVCITDTHENRLEDIIKNFDSEYLQYKVDAGRLTVLK